MSPNSAGVTSRPLVWILNWNGSLAPVGRAPIRPDGATMFCWLIAATTSVGDRFEATSRSVRNHTRME